MEFDSHPSDIDNQLFGNAWKRVGNEGLATI